RIDAIKANRNSMAADPTDDNFPAPLVRTGIAGFDQILHGGFRAETSILIQGTPGSGKSALGLELLVNGITMYGEPGLILSFEQFPEHLYRDAASFGWDLKKMAADGLLRVIF